MFYLNSDIDLIKYTETLVVRSGILEVDVCVSLELSDKAKCFVAKYMRKHIADFGE